MGRKKQYEREAILALATEIFRKNGFEATSLSSLEAATGLNKKSLYAEFESKEALFQASLDFYMQQKQQEAGCLLLREPLGKANIAAFFRSLNYKPGETGCLLGLTMMERHSVSKLALDKLNKRTNS